MQLCLICLLKFPGVLLAVARAFCSTLFAFNQQFFKLSFSCKAAELACDRPTAGPRMAQEAKAWTRTWISSRSGFERSTLMHDR